MLPLVVLEAISLYTNDITDTGARFFASVLSTNLTLRHLELADNPIDDDGSIALADAFCLNSSVEKLFLGDTHFRDVGVSAWRRVLETNTTLTQLDLDSEEYCISESTVLILREGLNANSTLRDLCLPDQSWKEIDSITTQNCFDQRLRTVSLFQILSLLLYDTALLGDPTDGDQIFWPYPITNYYRMKW